MGTLIYPIYRAAASQMIGNSYIFVSSGQNNRGYYMAALRNKISFQRLKNNSQESAENN